MATASDLINRALRLIGALEPGESPSAQETADGLTALNAMVDSWQTEALVIYAMTNVQKTLTPSDASYTIGSGGDINTTRPVKINGAFITESSTDYPIGQISKSAYDAIAFKSSDSNIAEYFYYEPTYPLGTIYLYPTPNSANTLKLSLWVPIQSFAASSTAVSLPPGYERALTYNLAVEIAPEYGKSVSPEVAGIAVNSKAAIKRVNAASRPIIGQIEMMAGARHSDIFSDE